MRIIGITALALAMSALPLSSAATAQNRNVLNQQGGLVNVSVGNVELLKNFANNNEIEILNNANISVPVVVQAPISVAAAVCGVAVNVLARGGPSNNSCDAISGSEALTDLAIKQMQK
ncbi:MAG: hypothetical protein M3Q57_10555 [Pseudomonadota bacterium]|nr:hypothetical protein [Pseudomonadota bacterium]